ncbi:M48 family metallopeptidase [Acaryochloris thomasi]|nr:M48 family metallopeptidase [Acaryochloris thomasi]
MLYATAVPALYLLWQLTIPHRAMIGMGPDERTFEPEIFWTFWVWWTPRTLIIVSLVTLLIIGGGCFYKWRIIHRGGRAVAESLGGQLVPPDTQDRHERILRHVVEEMAIASGMPIPEVYVLRHEAEINAFAAGFTVNDAVIGVTQGCLKHLKRDELQGVIGHEFSHILNGDMRLNMLLISGLHGILIISIVGRWLRSESNAMGLGSALTITGRLNLLVGRLIQSAVSRQREFLADASAVQFTRDPQGLANALVKVLKQGSQIQTPEVESASHLFFGNVLRSKTANWWATHPPIEMRIEKLGVEVPDPKFDRKTRSVSAAQNILNMVGMTALANGSMPEASECSASVESGMEPDLIVNTVGTVAPEHLAYTQLLLAQLPDEMQQSLQYREDAIAIIYGLLLDHQESIQTRQLEFLLATESNNRVQAAQQIYERLTCLDPRMRLPLLDLTIPALRQSSVAQFRTLLEQVDALINCDGQCSLAEYSLRMILKQRLQPYFELAPRISKRATMNSLWPDCVLLLSALAHVGHPTAELQFQALKSGLQRLPEASKQTLPTQVPDFTLASLELAIERLSQSVPRLKQVIVDACAYTVLVDSVITLTEAELLRAIVIALNCPLPPFLKVLRP